MTSKYNCTFVILREENFRQLNSIVIAQKNLFGFNFRTHANLQKYNPYEKTRPTVLTHAYITGHSLGKVSCYIEFIHVLTASDKPALYQKHNVQV